MTMSNPRSASTASADPATVPSSAPAADLGQPDIASPSSQLICTRQSATSELAGLAIRGPVVDYMTYRSSLKPSTPLEKSGASRQALPDRYHELDMSDSEQDECMDVDRDDEQGLSDTESGQTHETASSSSSSRNSTLLMTPPPAVMPIVMADLLPSGPKRKRSITHLSGIPIDLIQAASHDAACQSPIIKAQRPIRGRKRVSFYTPLPPSHTSGPLSPSPSPSPSPSSLSTSFAPGEGAGTATTLGSLMRRMSVEPLRLQASRNRRAADREQRGEEVHRLDWESSPDVSLVRAEEEDSEYDSDESEDDDLVIII